MKTIFTLMAIMMATVIGTAGTTPGGKHLTIQGKFISQTNVQYDVYIINSDSSLDAQATGKAFKFFDVQLQLNERYLIKFTSKTDVKYLCVETSVPGTFTVDVNFREEGSAEMRYTYGSYYVVPVSNKQFEYVSR